MERISEVTTRHQLDGIQRMFAKSDRQPQCEEECMEYIEKHLQHFCRVYMRED